jgi:hypothetical protein
VLASPRASGSSVAAVVKPRLRDDAEVVERVEEVEREAVVRAGEVERVAVVRVAIRSSAKR